MSIDRLIREVQVVGALRNAGEHDWKSIQEHYSLEFPVDYKYFIDYFGTGSIEKFLWVLNPFSENINLNFLSALYLRDAYTEMQINFPDIYNREKFPKSGSFFHWAISDNGDSLFWCIDGNSPDQWMVGVHSSDQADEEITNLNTQEFLVKIFLGGFDSRILPSDFCAIAPKRFFCAP